MQAGTILIVDDNKSVLTSLELLLEDEFEGVETASNPNSILSVLDSRPVDLVLLDMNFSAGVNTGNEGLFWLRRIREIAPELPVIMLTALGTTEDIVKGLDAGADDYLVKPFSFQELEARIKALLRRNKEVTSNLLTCDNLILDCNTRRAKRGNIDIDLTVKEYRLLEYFMTHQGVALSRITLLKDVWDKNFDTNTNIVDVYVNYLRVKIDRDFDKKLIHTVVGLGYIMNA